MLMSRDEVAEHLGIAPEAVRSTLRRYGIRELRGYPREAVEKTVRPGRGWRRGRSETQADPAAAPQKGCAF